MYRGSARSTWLESIRMPGQARNVVRVHVGDEGRGDLLPSQIEAADRRLGALAAVEEEELPLAAEEDAGQRAIRQGHHAARAEDEGFQIHRGRLSTERRPGFNGWPHPPVSL